jgi:Flp pilus assembly protein TadG
METYLVMKRLTDRPSEQVRTAAARPSRADHILKNLPSGVGRSPRLARCERGQSTVEFAIVAPLLLTLLVAVVVFGIAYNNYLSLTFATDAGSQLLSISRGQTTDPCQTASQAVYSAAPQLTQANLKFSIVLGTNTVVSNTANPSCSGSQQYLVQAANAQVTVTYPCNLNILGFNPVPNCALTAQTTMLIQ